MKRRTWLRRVSLGPALLGMIAGVPARWVRARPADPPLGRWRQPDPISWRRPARWAG
ncbi:MAG: hypothetical protein N2652_09790 [Kiritimatiellae bacterium]|nr:hypothetical protein [Kiritimatiellia bacterium]